MRTLLCNYDAKTIVRKLLRLLNICMGDVNVELNIGFVGDYSSQIPESRIGAFPLVVTI